MVTFICTLHLCLGIWLGLSLARHNHQKTEIVADSPIPPSHLHIRGAEALEREVQAVIQGTLELHEPVKVDVLLRALHKLLEITRELRGQLVQVVSGKHEPDPASADQADQSGVPAGLPCELRPTRHQVADADESAQRHPYRASQWAAEVINERLPEPRQFTRVQCLELSTRELTYVADEWPQSQFIVVSLGRDPEVKFMLAEVVQQGMKFFEDEWRECVRCRFVKRLESDVYAWNSEQQCLAMWRTGRIQDLAGLSGLPIHSASPRV